MYGRVYSVNIQVKGANNPVSISRWLDKHNVVTHTAGGLSATKEGILTVLSHERALKTQEIKQTHNETHVNFSCVIYEIFRRGKLVRAEKLGFSKQK